MTCDVARTAFSALMDGERADGSEQALQHLNECVPCRHWMQAVSVLDDEVVSMIRSVSEVDRTSAIMGALAEQRTRGHGLANGVRIVLAIGAVAQLASALVHMSHVHAFGHLSAELHIFQIGLAVVLGAVAQKPDRALTALPFLAVIAAGSVCATALELARGTTSLSAQSSHVSAVVGVVLVWLLARSSQGRSWVPVFR